MTPEELAELQRLATKLENLGKRYAVFIGAGDRADLKRAVLLARKAVQSLTVRV